MKENKVIIIENEEVDDSEIELEPAVSEGYEFSMPSDYQS